MKKRLFILSLIVIIILLSIYALSYIPQIELSRVLINRKWLIIPTFVMGIISFICSIKDKKDE